MKLSAVFAAALFGAAAGAAPTADPELPLIEVPATMKGAPDAPLVIFLSGDGGWAEFVREISKRLAADGWDVLGFNLRTYLSTRRTPDEAAAAVNAVIQQFRERWHRDRVVVAGFSRGADLAPFIVNRLPAATREQVELVVLLSPGRQAEFEFHLADFWRQPAPSALRPVADEVSRLGRKPVLILHGEKDDEALVLPAAPGRVIKMPGDHHLGRDYPTIVKLVEAAARGAGRATPPAGSGVRR